MAHAARLRAATYAAVTATVLAGLAVLPAAPAQASGLPTGVTVSVGYADNFHSSGFFPTPWLGDPGVIFEGCGAGCSYDGGAIEVVNGSASTVTVNALSVAFGSCRFAIWPANVAVPAGQRVIYAQRTSGASNGCATDGTFDSSDVGPNGAGWAGNCTQSGVTPQVELTVDAAAVSVTDSAQALNTGGVDLADCPAGSNESEPWTRCRPR